MNYRNERVQPDENSMVKIDIIHIILGKKEPG
jgi:hypothetical protein